MGYMAFPALLQFVVGLVLLVRGADWFVDAASGVARRFGVSPFFIGLTVVAFGTSAPELVVNLTSALSGNGDLALGNILGSNISNTLLVLGLAAIIQPLAVARATAWKEIPLNVLVAVLLLAMSADALLGGGASLLSRADGTILLLCFVAFMAYSIALRSVDDEAEAPIPSVRGSVWRTVFFIAAGLIGLVVGGMWVVDGAVAIARGLGVGEAIIGLTIIAVGTSLPELVTSVVAAYKRSTGIAVGNIIGSNIFNILFVLGLTSVLAPLPVSRDLQNDMLIMATTAVLLVVAVFAGKRYVLDRKSGFVLLTLYGAYMVFLVAREYQHVFL